MAPFFATSAAPQTSITYSCVSCRRAFTVAHNATWQGCSCGAKQAEVMSLLGATYPQSGTDKASKG